MARLAIFIDGAYVDALTRHIGLRVDYDQFVEAVQGTVANRTPGELDLLRAYYYDCLPYQSNPPTEEEKKRFSGKRKFFDRLGHIRRFQVREGRLAKIGVKENGQPAFRQKRTDLLLGLDFASLSSKRQITHVALVAGDSDFLPAIEVAKEEGVLVWLFHGGINERGESTYAQELWRAADERFELVQSFLEQLRREG